MEEGFVFDSARAFTQPFPIVNRSDCLLATLTKRIDKILQRAVELLVAECPQCVLTERVRRAIGSFALG
jgi:hypothetical protein